MSFRIAAAAACLVAICGCGSSEKRETEFARGGTYTEALGADPGNLHPLLTQQIATNEVVSFAYDTLINIDRDGKVVPQLAERWDVTPRRVTYTLRDGVTCADGTPLRARDVAANYEWIKDPKHQSSLLGSALPSGDFTVAADDVARTVTLTVPDPYGFLVPASGLVPIVCPDGLKDPKRLAHATDGTGPFVLEDAVADDHLTFAVRKGYRWGPNGATTAEPGFPSRVVFKIVKDESTAANLLLSGGLSAAAVTGPDRARLEGQGFQKSEEAGGPQELWFNQRAGHPGADPAFRRALVSALDLDQLTKVVTQGIGSRATSLTVLEPRPCRAETARGALPAHDPGAGAGLDGTNLTLIYPGAGGPIASTMELLADQLEPLGVKVTLRGLGATAYQKALFEGGSWDLAWLSVGLAYPNEMTAFVTGPPSPAGQNFAAVRNADYARLAGEALKTPGAAGCELWAQADRALLENLDVVPVATDAVLGYARRARIREGIFGTEPTSIRLLAG
ncbi:MAG TPA: ABC transporter substrate-binding protein [Solirubrobacteraceae bacterium]|nr:ABC transporter substrate-binding protein [Solirubrobacteraceae bacterium]